MPLNYNLEDDDDELLYGNVQQPRDEPMPFEEEVPAPIQFGPENNPEIKQDLPNVPRDPDDPNEKLKNYFKRQDELAQQSLRGGRQDAEMYRRSNSQIGLGQLLNQSANQFGSLGGKAASSAPLDQFSQGLRQSNAQEMQMAGNERKAAVAGEDRKLKMMDYLQRQGFQTRSANDRREAADKADIRGNRSLDIQENRNKLLANKPPKPTMGMQRRDTDYAKDYNDWVGSGRSIAEKNLTLLKSTKKKLELLGDDSWVSGKVVGNLSPMLRTEESNVLEQDVKQAAASALKATLGAAFGQREGENIQKLSYDPTLSPSANAKKIQLAIEEIESSASIAEQRAKYFEQNDTLQGWSDPRSSMTVDEVSDQKEKNLNPPVAPPPPPPGMVNIRDPKGKIKVIPVDQKEAAIAAGGKVVQ